LLAIGLPHNAAGEVQARTCMLPCGAELHNGGGSAQCSGAGARGGSPWYLSRWTRAPRRAFQTRRHPRNGPSLFARCRNSRTTITAQACCERYGKAAKVVFFGHVLSGRCGGRPVISAVVYSRPKRSLQSTPKSGASESVVDACPARYLRRGRSLSHTPSRLRFRCR
jgi:hypothetical protein